MTCKLCKERGKPESFGSDPKCAFPDGVFTSDNWNCATMNALRDIAGSYRHGNEDQYAEVIPATDDDECTHIVLTWYKSRGRTEGAWMLFDDRPPEPLTLEVAENIIYANDQHTTEQSGGASGSKGEA